MSNKTVVIIGGGIVGSSIGFHLSNLNNTVIILDKGPFQDSCSSHSFAWVNAGSKSPIGYHKLCRSSVENWPAFAKKLNTEVGLNLNGTLKWENTAAGAEFAKKRVEELQSWGYHVEIVDEQFINEKEPTLKLKDLTFAQFTKNEGHVEPKRVIDACQFKIKENGGQIINNCEVTGFITDTKTNHITAINTTSGDIVCDSVVIAAGTGTEQLSAMLNINIPLLQSPGVVAWTDPQPKAVDGLIMSPAISGGKYPGNDDKSEVHIRQRVDGSYQLVNERRGDFNEQIEDSQEKAEQLLQHLAEYFPQLEKAKAIAEPVGYRPMPEDRFPVVGFDDTWSNVYISVTHSGVTLAPIIGELASIEINYNVKTNELENYRPSRFKQ
jgi:glycine/D-amino acid oxidase-like deaminating enzyme